MADGNLGTARNEKFILVLLYLQQQITTYEERLTRVTILKQAQLMLTNLCDVFGGQSRSPNIVPFHILGTVSYCAIVTLS